jgi:inorganic pyrophosphatase
MENYIWNLEFDMIVEIPLNSNVKYEYDKKLNKMRCDRIISTSMLYPGNYGYIPETLSGDGDPLDILLICDYPIYPGTIVSVKVIGVLMTEDENGEDEKLIAVPSHCVDNNSSRINSYKDLGKYTLIKIKHFFEHYKDNEKNKWVKVGDYENQSKSLEIINQSKKRYQSTS